MRECEERRAYITSADVNKGRHCPRLGSDALERSLQAFLEVAPQLVCYIPDPKCDRNAQRVRTWFQVYARRLLRLPFARQEDKKNSLRSGTESF